MANGTGNSVTELNATTGRLIRFFAGKRYRFNDPDAIVAAGNRVWAGDFIDSVTEFKRYDRCAGPRHIVAPNSPFAMTADAASVWVTMNSGAKAPFGDGSVTELSARTGALIRVFFGSRH